MPKKDKRTGCTRKQEAFCQAYAIPTSLSFRNLTKSAEKAGYTEKHSPHRGYILFRNKHIKARIKDILDDWISLNPAYTEDSVLLKHINLMERAEKEGDLGEARANLIKIGEIGGIYKQRQLIQAEVIAVSVEISAEQNAAMQEAARVFKLKMANEGEDPERGRSNPLKLVESTTYPSEDENKDENKDVNKAIVQAIEDVTKEAETVEETERIPAHLVGRGPGKPTHSVDNFR